MVQLGEVSAGRQALEGASLAAGDQKTLNALRDPTRRPAVPRDSLPDDIAGLQPEEPFVLDQVMFLHNVRTARKGAAPGPSGMTADHMRLLVEHSGPMGTSTFDHPLRTMEMSGLHRWKSVPGGMKDSLRHTQLEQKMA